MFFSHTQVLELLQETTTPLVDPLLTPQGRTQLIAALCRQARAEIQPSQGMENLDAFWFLGSRGE